MNMDKVFYGLLTLLLIPLFFAVKGCHDERSARRIITSTLSKERADYAKEFKAYRDSLGRETVVKTITVVPDQATLEALFRNDPSFKERTKKFKTIEYIGVVSTDVRSTDTLLASLSDTIPCEITKPISFINNDTTSITVKGQITSSTKARITEVSFAKDTTTIVIGDYKEGLFRRPELTMVMSHSNKYFKATEVEMYMVEVKKKWYQKGVTKFVAGAIIATSAIIYIQH